MTQRLEAQVSGARAQFARTGDPSCRALGEWPACTKARRTTMILDEACRVQADEDRALAELMGREEKQ